MRAIHQSVIGFAVPVLTMIVAVTGCTETSDPSGNSGPSTLRRFESADELLTYFKDQATARTVGSRNTLFDAAPSTPLAGTTNEATGADSGGGGGTQYSSTNLQEAGVDESDVFKSDGRFFYVASGSTLHVVKAAPRGEMAEVGHITLDNPIDSMYLIGDTVLTLSRKWGSGGGGPELLIWPPYFVGGSTVVSEINVADTAAPALVRTVELDGSLATSRLTSGRLILVLAVAPQLPASPTRTSISRMTLSQVMPKLRTAEGEEQDLIPWQDWLRPTDPDGYNMTAVVTLDAADISQPAASVAVLAGAGTVYASTRALYVTDTDYTLEGGLKEATSIHKFAFDRQGTATYVASGSVPGRLLNQFSLGEQDDFLRVATYVLPTVATPTRGITTPDVPVSNSGGAAQTSRPPDQPSNSVYVLGEAEGELSIKGAVEGLAPGERIYSARFLGSRGFLVTFRQIDPLFALDLSDPAAPRVVGELKIPGYSDYLHPIGEKQLLGVGRSTSMTPWGGVVPDKLQISLFDVSDLANPTVIQKLELGGAGSFSEVSQTHKAFTFLPGSGLLALPAWLESTSPVGNRLGPTGPAFSGVLYYRVAESGITLLGTLPTVVTADGNPYYSFWQRGAFIDQTAYAVNPSGVVAAELSNFADQKTVTLEVIP